MPDRHLSQSGATSSPYEDMFALHSHREGCSAAFTGAKCECPGPRHYVLLDLVLQALEDGYHPQNPSDLHPADYLRRRFGV